MAEQTSDKVPEQKVVPIEWPDADVAVYANNMLATWDGNAFYLTFCQTHLPVILGTEEEKRKQLGQIDNIKARPVARVVVPLNTMREIIRVLQEQLGNIDAGKPNDADAPNT